MLGIQRPYLLVWHYGQQVVWYYGQQVPSAPRLQTKLQMKMKIHQSHDAGAVGLKPLGFEFPKGLQRGYSGRRYQIAEAIVGFLTIKEGVK